MKKIIGGVLAFLLIAAGLVGFSSAAQADGPRTESSGWVRSQPDGEGWVLVDTKWVVTVEGKPAQGEPTIPNPEYVPESTVTVFDHWQRYSLKGKYKDDFDQNTQPPSPSENPEMWQANVEGDPHDVGVEGAYYRSNGNSGKGDWFYLEAHYRTETAPAQGEPTIPNPDYVQEVQEQKHQEFLYERTVFDAYTESVRWVLPESWPSDQTPPGNIPAIWPQTRLVGELECGRWSQDDVYLIDSPADVETFNNLGDTLENGEDSSIYKSHTFTYGGDCGVVPDAPTLTDVCGTADDGVILPVSDVVDYRVGSVVPLDNGDVRYRVVATPKPGHKILPGDGYEIVDGKAVWKLVTTNNADCPTEVDGPSDAPTVVDECGDGNLSYVLPDSNGDISWAYNEDGSITASVSEGSIFVNVTVGELSDDGRSLYFPLPEETNVEPCPTEEPTVPEEPTETPTVPEEPTTPVDEPTVPEEPTTPVEEPEEPTEEPSNTSSRFLRAEDESETLAETGVSFGGLLVAALILLVGGGLIASAVTRRRG